MEYRKCVHGRITCSSCKRYQGYPTLWWIDGEKNMGTNELTEREFNTKYQYFMNEYKVMYRHNDIDLLASRNGGFIVEKRNERKYLGPSKHAALEIFNNLKNPNRLVEKRIKDVIRESLNIEKDAIIRNDYKLDMIIMLYGGESGFERKEIMEHIKDEFNIKIEDYVFDRLETVQDIIDLVKGYENERTKNVV